jgi:hypothetical protein
MLLPHIPLFDKNSPKWRYVRKDIFQGAIIGFVVTLIAVALGASNGIFSEYGTIPDLIGNTVLGAIIIGFIGYSRVQHWES